ISSKAASLASRLVQSNRELASGHGDDDPHEDVDDEEALFAELEAEIENNDNAAVREKGFELLRTEMDRAKAMAEQQYGQYTEVVDEKEVIRITASLPRCVVHFYHSNFKRCEIMDKHLAKLASKYFNTRFFRVFVENVPWLIEKLSIKVLPCVICFMGGVAKDRLIGFEELGNNDVFDTATLEMRLSMSGVLQKPLQAGDAVFKIAAQKDKDDEDEFDLDD
ncbi:thioredoxin-like protein, partial [Fistulina hepatica ATCC 64428]